MATTDVVSSVSTTSEQNERLLSLSDALFAIALTFLALDLGEVPEGIGTPGEPSVPEFLHEHIRDYGVYFVTFLVVAVFWLRHHLIFRYVKRTSGLIIWLNVGILALVAFLPYPAGLLADAPDVPLALLALILPLFVLSLLIWLQWEIGNRQGLAMPGLPRATFINIRAQLAVSPAVLAVGLCVAYVAYLQDSSALMRIAEVLWLLLVFAPWVVSRIWRPSVGAYEIPESTMGPQWRSYAETNAKLEAESRSILARIKGGSDADRLKVLTDGVVAIAVTILALQLRPPDEDGPITTETISENLAHAQIWTYWITFVYILLFWMAHVRIFNRIQGSNNVVLWLNMVFLMFLAFLPMPSVLMSDTDEPAAAVLYLSTLFLTSVALTSVGLYAIYRLGFTSGFVSERARKVRALRSITFTGSFLLAIACVLIFDNAVFVNLVWIVMLISGRLAQRFGDPAEMRATST